MGEGEGNKASYIEHIGIFFFFVACAGVSIIVWVFNWICWYNQCCCCDFLHNPVNKRLVWWTSFIFALGILACCISGFVTTNRFGFALEGSRCSFQRLYYDSKYGQLQETFPRWEGFTKISTYLTNLVAFLSTFQKINIAENFISDNYAKGNYDYFLYDGYYTRKFLTEIEQVKDNEKSLEIIKYVIPITSRFGKVVDSMYKFNKFYVSFTQNITSLLTFFSSLPGDFQTLKNDFLDEFSYYAKVGKACGKVLTMIYFCLLCIAITFAGVSLMFYACLRRQGYLQTFMHILWNIIRFFIFSYFFYGAAYGMCYLALRDAIAYVMFVFGDANLKTNEISYLVPKNQGRDYLHFCIVESDSNYKNKLDHTLVQSLNDFFTNFKELENLYVGEYKNIKSDRMDYNIEDESLDTLATEAKKMLQEIRDFFQSSTKNFCNRGSTNYADCYQFPEMSLREGGIFGSFNCTFLKSDLHMMYRTLFDLSFEARILCALSCCIGFFGAIFVYFFLLVMHHYNNELFFDKGQNIFTGFEGYGNTRKKNSKDPSYKKRKMRAEIELSSRNEEYSGYHAANKNED